MALHEWLEDRMEPLSDRWLREVLGRFDSVSNGGESVLKRFIPLMTRFLPAVLGPFRDQVEPLWTRAAELFGTTAAHRGLAAGEVVEEMQILRECVIRLLYQDPPTAGRARLSLPDVLRLNRAIDRAVTHASVGHTDALFFSLFEGSGVPGPAPTTEMVNEVAEQLVGLNRELRAILGRVPGDKAR